MPFGLGIWEIVILAVVLMLLFGAKGVPAAARRLGTGVRELKDAVGEMDPRSMLDGDETTPKAAAPPATLPPGTAGPVRPDPAAPPEASKTERG